MSSLVPFYTAFSVTIQFIISSPSPSRVTSIYGTPLYSFVSGLSTPSDGPPFEAGWGRVNGSLKPLRCDPLYLRRGLGATAYF